MSAPSLPDVAVEVPWRRLNVRVIWVDVIVSLVSLLPSVTAVVFVGVEPSLSTLWPLILVAVFGVFGALLDILRWVFTRYRLTDTDLERRSGALVRRHRILRRELIRSVDTHAKLRHRLVGLRVVTVGAGQQTGASEAALFLDGLTKDDAAQLRRELLEGPRLVQDVDPTEDTGSGQPTHDDVDAQVLATFRPWWVVYNMFSIWTYLMAAGLLWVLFWITSTFGADLFGLVSGIIDWTALGWLSITGLVLAVGGAIGALCMALNFFTSYWQFELAQVRSGENHYLRTKRGFFSTREVSRDEARMRGLSIDEPLLWRWMGMADTNVITTGLNIWGFEQPTTILPRGPVRLAREVARQVLGETRPFDKRLPRHPPAALRRRLGWATVSVIATLATVAVPVATNAAPPWLIWAVLTLWPLALLGALVAYRALGHAIVDEYVVVRSGLLSRSTSALRRDAVSTISVRQSVLQKRLGLSTVTAMTSAGWGAYEALDVAAVEAVGFADQAAPGLIDEFIIPVE